MKKQAILADTSVGKIEYTDVGQGQVIVFLHGGHSNCFETISHKGFDLTKYRLITPSRPGYGSTPLEKNESPRQAAKLILSLLEQLSIDHVTAYGISAGGLTAIEMAALDHKKVTKLVLASAVTKEWLDKNGSMYKTAKLMFSPRMESFIWSTVRFFSRLFPKLIAANFYPQFTTQKAKDLRKEEIFTNDIDIHMYISKLVN